MVESCVVKNRSFLKGAVIVFALLVFLVVGWIMGQGGVPLYYQLEQRIRAVDDYTRYLDTKISEMNKNFEEVAPAEVEEIMKDEL